MKKLFPYILIVLIVVQLLAPFTVGIGVKNNLEIRNNKVEADFITIIGPNNNGIVLETIISKTNKSITIDATVIWTQGPALLTQEGVQVTITDPVSGVATPRELTLSSFDKQTDGYHQTGSTTFSDLTPLTTYNIRSEARQINQLTLGTGGLKWSKYQLWNASPQNIDPTLNNLFFNVIREDNVKTLDSGDQTTVIEDKQITRNMDSALPNCVLAEAKTWPGCFGIGLYHLIFRPTAFLFAKIGQILDFAVDYSVRDKSYRSAFVVEGWGVVRDFCNMFFIFILLYIAFGTILKLNGVKTKEMIINVVIIGLLINFSLFATQVIIDASNILTRVFYNTITVGPMVNGVVQEKRGPLGEIKLSEAIVAKINPQDLIFRAAEVNDIQIKGELGSGETIAKTGVSAGTFIIVTILASIINIVGLLTFLSCSLIFISRVVGLWLAMIFAPLAFFSYTIPAMQDWEMVGWKRWWPETLKMAFLAPVFVFFMYLIIKFLETGLGLSGVLGIDKSKMDLILGIFVPFIFIMILLTKAKDLAKKMSGTIGQSITNGLAAVGGVALGGAALGTALLGRKILGGGLAAASRTDSAQHFATQKIAHNKKLEEWEANGKKGPKPEFEAPEHGSTIMGADGKAKLDKNGNEIKYNALTGRLGGNLNATQRKVGDIDHARHEEDEIKKAAGQVDPITGQVLDNSRITGEGEKVMENKFNQTKRPEAEAAARKGTDTKGNAVLLNEGTPDEVRGEEAFKSANRNEIADRIRKESADNTDGDGKLTPTALKKVENELNIKLNAAVKIAADKKLSGDFSHMREKASTPVNIVTRTFSGANKASYDVRNLSEAKSDKREGMFSKIPVALVAAVAMGVRGGLKSVGTSHGSIKVEGNFMKDLGNTISDSLKEMKVNVDLGHVGETKSSANAHGGGGDKGSSAGAHH